MSTIKLSGRTVTAASVTIPMFGPMVADVTLAEPFDVGASVTVSVGTMDLRGTVIRSAAFAGSQTLRIVGGAGGWRKSLVARGYSHLAGVRLSSILNDAARECGETIAVASDRVVGTFWTRDEGRAQRALKLLLDGQWWVDGAGVTQTKARPTGDITSPFQVISWTGSAGRFEIATEAYHDWLPGRSFTSRTIGSTQTIALTTFTSDNSGILRLTVLNTSNDRERMTSQFRSIVRDEMARASYAGHWEYRIVSATSSTVDAVSLSPGKPDLTRVPMYPGLCGESVTPSPGSTCRIHFVNQDPSRPECIHIDGDPVSATIGGASTASVSIGSPGALPLARGPATVAAFGAVATYIAAVTAAASANPTSYTPFAAAILGPGAAAAAALGLVGAAVPTTVAKGK